MQSTLARNAAKLRTQADRDPKLSFGAKLLLGHLLRFARRREGVAYPSRATLAGLLNRSLRMVGHYLRELRERGYIRWLRTRRQPNVYAFELNRVDDTVERLRADVFNDAPYWFAGGKFRNVRMNIRRVLGRPEAVEPARACEAALAGGQPPVIKPLSVLALATRAGRAA